MYCSQCGKKLPDDAQFCGFCGASLLQKKLTCPVCGHEHSREMLYCCYCGAQLADSLAETPNQAPAQTQTAPYQETVQQRTLPFVPTAAGPVYQETPPPQETPGPAKVWQQGGPAGGQEQAQTPVVVPEAPTQPEAPVCQPISQPQETPGPTRVWQQGDPASVPAQQAQAPVVVPEVSTPPEVPVYQPIPQPQETPGPARVWNRESPASAPAPQAQTPAPPPAPTQPETPAPTRTWNQENPANAPAQQAQAQQAVPFVQAAPPPQPVPIAQAAPQAIVAPAVPQVQEISLPADPSAALKAMDRVDWVLGEHKMAVINGSGSLSLYPDRLELKLTEGNRGWGAAFGLIGYAVSKSKVKKAPPVVFAMNEIAVARASKYMGSFAIVLEMKNGAKHTLVLPFGAQVTQEWVQIIQALSHCGG